MDISPKIQHTKHMRPARLHELLKHSFTHGRRVLIKGKPGIGKSDIGYQSSQAVQFDYMLFHPAISDPTSFEGLPANVNGHAEFLPYGQLRALLEATKPTVAFLDDIGQAAPAVQAALMQLILARRVNGHIISDKVVFCGATNDTSHLAGVSGMIEPLKSRWDTIVELEVSVDDWCNWALDHGMPAELMAFIRFRPNLLSDFKPTKELRNSPSPRGWGSIGNWINDDMKDLEVFQGAVGEGAATELFAFLDSYADLPSLDAILLDPIGTPVPQKPGQCFAVAGGLARKCTPANFDRVTKYTSRMPKEFDICCVRDAVRLDRKITTSRGYTEWAIRNQDVLL